MRQAIEDSGGVVPSPDVPDWLQPVWQAWHRLSADRPWLSGGMGAPVPLRIPWRDIVQWCEVHDEDVDFYDAMFAVMDDVFFIWRREHT